MQSHKIFICYFIPVQFIFDFFALIIAHNTYSPFQSKVDVAIFWITFDRLGLSCSGLRSWKEQTPRRLSVRVIWVHSHFFTTVYASICCFYVFSTNFFDILTPIIPNCSLNSAVYMVKLSYMKVTLSKKRDQKDNMKMSKFYHIYSGIPAVTIWYNGY